ncbi:MAG: NADH-quinone oxidoreductase subunit A [Deltaproteobacteria bacterium]|nr:NADH-quinone oxidoreductase subunit A [Deltaproteobacteria bacterium]
METGFIAAFWFLLISALTVPLLLGVGALFRPKQKKVGHSSIAYECGELPVGSAWVRFNVRFYVVAIIFIIFDVELAALFPCLVLYKDAVISGNAALIFCEIFLFVGLLLAGLVYCWVHGDLEWVKGLAIKSGKNG